MLLILFPHELRLSQFPGEYIVAGHRFNIVEDFGCAPATYNTPLTYFLVESWPLVIGAASACYGGEFSFALPNLKR